MLLASFRGPLVVTAGFAKETVPFGVYLRPLASGTTGPKTSKIGSEFHRLLAGVVLLWGRVPSPSKGTHNARSTGKKTWDLSPMCWAMWTGGWDTSLPSLTESRRSPARRESTKACH